MKENDAIDEILRNRSIIRSIANLRSRRRKYAIYRLYRYFSLSPQEIVALLEDHFEWTRDDRMYVPHNRNRIFYHKVSYITRSIGQIFSELCIKDQQCVFRKFLKR